MGDGREWIGLRKKLWLLGIKCHQLIHDSVLLSTKQQGYTLGGACKQAGIHCIKLRWLMMSIP